MAVLVQRVQTASSKMKFGIVCDSAADLSQQEVAASGIQVVPFYVSLDGTDYLKEGADISPLQFYQNMVDHPDAFPKTSTPTIPDFAEAFYSVIQKGLDVLCICLTQKFSSSYQSALSAKALVESELPDARIHVMDSQLVTDLEGALVSEAVRLRDAELDLQSAAAELEEVRQTGHIFFTTKDLKYLRNGGRLSSAAYIAGSMLDIKPLLHFHHGDLDMDGICRGQKRSLRKIADNLIAFIKEHKIDMKDYILGTGVGLACAEYDSFIELLKEKMEENNIAPFKWIQIQIGATIGVHTGPYPVGLGFLKRCKI